MSKNNLKYAIIGIGRVGLTFLKVLDEEGFCVSGIVDKNIDELIKKTHFFPKQNCKQNIADLPAVDIIIIAVPDDRIVEVVGELEHVFIEKKPARIVFHTSGLLTSKVLHPLRKYDVAVASCHPVQSFSGDDSDSDNLRNIYCAIEGDESALNIIRVIAERLNNKLIVISQENKPAHHLACTFASNYFNALISVSVEILGTLGLSTEDALKMLSPLVQTTLNNINKSGLEDAISGPISRGDVETVKEHLKQLSEKFPHYQNLYQNMGQILLSYATIMKKISPEKVQLVSSMIKKERDSR